MNVKEAFQIRPTNEEQNDFIITVGQHLATEQHFKKREEAEQYRDTPHGFRNGVGNVRNSHRR